MKTVLITGANRGIGLEFCRQYAAEGWRVIACCRKPVDADALNNWSNQYSSIQVEKLDVQDFNSIDQLSARLSEMTIDILINNAGVYGDVSNHGFGNLDYEAWTRTLKINSQAPIKMAEAFLAQLERSNTKLIVSISSLMGSLTDNGSGGSLLYRSSKAALNAAMKTLAIDLQRRSIGVLILHPGWVKTDMGGSNALIDTNESVSGMRLVINEFKLAQTGSFLKYDGKVLPW